MHSNFPIADQYWDGKKLVFICFHAVGVSQSESLSLAQLHVVDWKTQPHGLPKIAVPLCVGHVVEKVALSSRWVVDSLLQIRGVLSVSVRRTCASASDTKLGN